METCKLLVRHDLTENDKSVLAEQMSKIVARKIQVEEEKKESAARFNEIIKKYDAQIAEKAVVVNQGFDERYVKCEVIRDPRSRKMLYYRLDNRELVKTRKMTDDDLNQELPFSFGQNVVGGSLDGRGKDWGPFDFPWQNGIPVRTIPSGFNSLDDLNDHIEFWGPGDWA